MPPATIPLTTCRPTPRPGSDVSFDRDRFAKDLAEDIELRARWGELNRSYFDGELPPPDVLMYVDAIDTYDICGGVGSGTCGLSVVLGRTGSGVTHRGSEIRIARDGLAQLETLPPDLAKRLTPGFRAAVRRCQRDGVLLHEVVHQWQYWRGLDADHGASFVAKVNEICAANGQPPITLTQAPYWVWGC